MCKKKQKKHAKVPDDDARDKMDQSHIKHPISFLMPYTGSYYQTSIV